MDRDILIISLPPVFLVTLAPHPEAVTGVRTLEMSLSPMSYIVLQTHSQTPLLSHKDYDHPNRSADPDNNRHRP